METAITTHLRVRTPLNKPQNEPSEKPSEHLSAVALGPPKLYAKAACAKAEPNRKK